MQAFTALKSYPIQLYNKYNMKNAKAIFEIRLAMLVSALYLSFGLCIHVFE
jgi:hypothetical protein